MIAWIIKILVLEVFGFSVGRREMDISFPYTYYKKKTKKSTLIFVAIFWFCCIMGLLSLKPFFFPMLKYACTNCSYVYNPFIGDEQNPEGTFFDALEESWMCPHCGE